MVREGWGVRSASKDVDLKAHDVCVCHEPRAAGPKGSLARG
jgi:hypothetical protein